MATTYLAPSAPRSHGLDTLRAAAILLVIPYHLSLKNLLPASIERPAAIGWIGVDLFFVLSGYLIGSQLLRPYLAGGAPSIPDFYRRRAYRILPAYLVVLALYFAVPLWREADGPVAAWQYLSFTWNLFLVGYPDAHAFSHVWSLCVEEHFYLVLPFLLLFFMRKPNIRHVGAFLTAISLGGILLRWWLLHHAILDSSVPEDQSGLQMMRYIYYPTYTRLDGLLTGVTLALIRSFRPSWWQKVAPHGNVMLVAGICMVLAGLRLCGFNFPNPSRPAGIIFTFPVISMGFGMLVASAVCDRSVLKMRIPGAGMVAALAYSLYLTHKSVAHAVHRLLPSLTGNADWKATFIYALSCLGIASVLYFGVERPFLTLRMSRDQKRSDLRIGREVGLDPAI